MIKVYASWVFEISIGERLLNSGRGTNMAGFLRKLLPTLPSNHDDDDNHHSMEYSFAMEYHGPPVTYDVPLAVPVDIDQVPTAAAVVSASLVDNSSVPVIQPIVMGKPLSKKLVDKLKSGSEMTALGEPVGLSARGSSGAVGSLNGDESAPKLLDAIRSSGRFGFSKIHKDSYELLGSSDMLQLSNDCKDGGGFEDYLSHVSSDSSESGVSSEVLSSEDSKTEKPRHVKEPSSVTFRDPESYDIFQEESDHAEARNIHRRRAPERNVKKGLCYRCLKGNRFTEKEVCIVCSAKYCVSCVLRAMGSMPEGRKCVTCIGLPIEESRRRTLGKCSQMLKRLLSDLEIELIMRYELLCEVNQLPHELVCVNGEPLSQEEMVFLKSCPKPPKKLKPGRYWYDKVSGLWGKEGHRPCQIISPQLNVGGQIKRNASNGNTKILVNSREITEVEHWMMHVAGIRCVGNISLWLSADGTYQEEGQKNMIDPIGNKSGVRLLCAVFSLPILPDSANPSGGEVNDPVNEVGLNRLEQKASHKLFLIGPNRSGTSTIFKQAKLLYNVPFSEDERQNIKFMIQTNLYCYLGILLEGRERFEEEILTEMQKRQSVDEPGPSGNTGLTQDKTIYSIGPRLKAFSDWLLQVMVSGNLEVIFPAATREYAPLVEELWKDAAIQATYNRRSELKMLPRVASYFLDQSVEVSKVDYEPSDVDILYAEGITSSNGLACTEFSLEDVDLDPHNQPGTLPSRRFELIRVHPKNLGDNCKWLEMFEDVGIVLFCVSLSDYDELSDGLNGFSRNKMLESKKLFERVVTHPNFEHKDFLLILNKFDLLEEKIDVSPLTKCEWFHDFTPVVSHNYNSRSSISNTHSLAQIAFHYIALKFKTLFYSLTGRKLYVSSVTGLEPDTVGEALTYAGTILKWDEEKKPNYVLCDSSYSLDTSTS